MKKFMSLVLALSLLVGSSPAVLAKSSGKSTARLPENSSYAINYSLPDYVLTDQDTLFKVNIKTSVLGHDGYDDAYLKFSAEGPGSVNFSPNSDTTYVDQGILEDLDLPAQYDQTTNWILNFTDDGTYKITFALYDAEDQLLTRKAQEVRVADGIFLFTLPERIQEGNKITGQVKFITQQDYDNVHFTFAKISGPGNVVFKALDAAGDEYSFTNKGDLEPASFDIDGPYNETIDYQLTFSQDGTYQIAFRLVDEDDNILLQGSKEVYVKNVVNNENDEDEDNDDRDKDNKDKKGRTHGLVNAVRNHLKFKKNGKSLSESQSLKKLMELLEDRGLAQDLLQNLKDAIAELEEAIAELEKAIAADLGDDDDYRALAKMKALKGKKYETYINGKKVNYADAEPILENNRTLVPFRIIAEALGAEVSWNAKKQEITLTKGDNTVVLTIGKKTALVNGKTVTLDTPAKIHKNRTMIPLRFLAESLDAKVDYYPEGCVIVIKNK